MKKLVSTTSPGTFGPFDWAELAANYGNRTAGTPATIYVKIDGTGTVQLKGAAERNETPLPIQTYTESKVDALFSPVKFLWIEVESVSGTVEIWFDGGR